MNEQAGMDMIYLVACAIHDKVPNQSRVERMNLDDLYSMGQYHSLTACIASALEKSVAVADSSLMNKFKQAKEKAIRKNVLLDVEREQILSYMEDNGIWYASLKGIILKDFYPKYGMRQMADNDILYDSTYQKEILDYMKSRGYTAEVFDKGSHDTYIKPPVYNFEMHKSLFSAVNDKSLVDYYYNVKDRLLQNKSKVYEYYFSDDDFYIYNTAHSYKHFKCCGTGLRTLVDCYVYRQKKGDVLNLNYIETELSKMGISDYEKQCRTLSDKLFSYDCEFDKSTLSRDERETLDLFLYSGTYGNQDICVRNRLITISSDEGNRHFIKLKYYLRRIFLPLKEIQNSYPFFYRHKLFIPFLWFFRVFRIVFFRRDKLKSELAALKSSLSDENDK